MGCEERFRERERERERKKKLSILKCHNTDREAGEDLALSLVLETCWFSVRVIRNSRVNFYTLPYSNFPPLAFKINRMHKAEAGS